MARACPPDNRRWPLSVWLLALLALGTIALPGCGGCWGGNTNTAAAKKKKEDEEKAKKEKEKKKKAEKPKDDFEPLAVRMLPSDDPTQLQRTPALHAKPGHWIALSETLKANNYDFPGDLTAFAEFPSTNRPLEIENTTQLFSSWCPAILPKGQAKRIEALLYLPRRKNPALSTTYSLRSELRGARGGRAEIFSSATTTALKNYQFLIVVLASNPAAYNSFTKLNSVHMATVEAPGQADINAVDTLRHYHLLLPSAERSVPLPSHPLAWTTTAFILWDDINPAVLTNVQQEALLDWLHWGGQLIVSGPNSLDKLRGSFLGPYLPAEAAQTLKLEQAAFDELNATFSLQRAHSEQPQKGDALRKITILPERPVLGVELKMHPEAAAIEGTGGLVVERRVGGGRIAVTRFPLTDVRIKNWKNFDGFFNTVLLRRPARKFGSNEGGLNALTMNWKDPLLASMTFEPRLGSTLRYFTRDVGFLTTDATVPAAGGGETTELPTGYMPTPSGRPAPPASVPASPSAAAALARAQLGIEQPKYWPNTSTDQPVEDWHLAGYQSTDQSGVAAWNDQGAASEAARETLTTAAGIEIPKAEFVMKVLGIYLLVLVPLNWLIFWLLGRVEWAWVAAPIIAVVGAVAVIRLAQLDIGFARNRTEIAVLEVQGGYERAHLTRYTALYTSLTSQYTAAFDQPSSLALPFPGGKRDESFVTIATFSDVLFRRDKETSLSGIMVSSNTTGMVHSEQMLPLGTSPKVVESLVLVGDENKGFSVRNNTDITVRDVGLIRRRPGGLRGESPELETAFVLNLEPGTSAPLKFIPLKTKEVWLPEWNQSSAFGPAADHSQVRLTKLAQLASQQLRLLPGDVRLIGWTSELLPGLELRPGAPQNTCYTLVLAHLVRGALPKVQADANVVEDYLDPSYFPETDAEGNPIEPPDPTDPKAAL